MKENTSKDSTATAYYQELDEAYKDWTYKAKTFILSYTRIK